MISHTLNQKPCSDDQTRTHTHARAHTHTHTHTHTHLVSVAARGRDESAPWSGLHTPSIHSVSPLSGCVRLYLCVCVCVCVLIIWRRAPEFRLYRAAVCWGGNTTSHSFKKGGVVKSIKTRRPVSKFPVLFHLVARRIYSGKVCRCPVL